MIGSRGRDVMAECEKECTDSGFNEDPSGRVAETPSLQHELAGLSINARSGVQYMRSPSCEKERVTDGQARLCEQNEDGDTLLHLAILDRNEFYARKIIEVVNHKDVLEIKNNNGLTPLILAVRLKMYETAHMLLVNGVHTDCIDYQSGSNILHIAVENRDHSMLKVILHTTSAFRDLANARNRKGLTPLHLAAMTQDIYSCQILAMFGADVNAQDHRSGNTSLHLAVLTEDAEFVRDIVAKISPDLDIASYGGYTPYGIAIENNLEDIGRILLQAGASGETGDVEFED